MARMRRWLRRLALRAGVGLVLGVVGLGIVYWLVAPQLPDVQELRNVALQVPLSVYTADGKLIAQFGETRRYPVKVEAVPTRLKQAFIAIEDARFYEHQAHSGQQGQAPQPASHSGHPGPLPRLLRTGPGV